MGGGVTDIGYYAFWDCDMLTRATFVKPEGWTVGGAEISAVGLSDPATAAGYLNGTYFDPWERK